MPGETVTLHQWEDPESGNIVEFAAVLVSPLEGAHRVGGRINSCTSTLYVIINPRR
jgi:hypothetical protein